MQTAYEALGRKQLQIEAQDESYAAILQLLASVVGGQIDRSRVMVNLTDKTWSVAAVGQKPTTPGTINGVPVCVISSNDPLQAEIDSLREQLEQAKADKDTAAFAKENAELAAKIQQERNGVFADVTG